VGARKWTRGEAQAHLDWKNADSSSAGRRLALKSGAQAWHEPYDAAVELDDYQRLSRRTAEYPREAWLTYPALGLCGEAGEVAEHAKKAIRDDGGEVSTERKAKMSKELGDVLWYVAQLASELGLELEQIAHENLEKLLSRQQRGVLSGDGDNR
jgi:NTP pyrophosphatase (non-canonical NTP hydrolase)